MPTVSPEDVIAIVLGGGRGTRLYPLTKFRSKPAVPLAGKYRIVDVPISNCLNSRINRIFVLTQYNSASLNRHISETYRFDRFSKGFVSILAAEQTRDSADWFQGTADAVRQTLHHLDSHRHSHALILSGDQLYHMDYRKMLRHHMEKDADISIATIPITADEAPAFGILKTDQNGLITEFHEKPPRDELDGLESPVSDEMESAGRQYLASMGIYVFNRDLLREELQRDHSQVDFGKEIIPSALDRRDVYSYSFTDYWSDIGTISSFYEGNLDLTSRLPSFDLYDPEQPIYTEAHMLSPAKIQRSEIQSSIIGEGSLILNSTIKNSVIGLRSFIADDTTIRDSVIMGADYLPWQRKENLDDPNLPESPGVGKECHIEGAILDKNVKVGTRCILRNRDDVTEGEGENFYIRDGIIVIPKNTSIPDGTII